MSGAAGIRRGAVVLPWAPPLPGPIEGAVSATSVAPTPVSSEDVAVRPQPRYGAGRTNLAPELRTVGLPYTPPPTLPEGDRTVVRQDELVRAAVALDVLATDLRGLSPTTAVLHAFARALQRTGELGGLDATDYTELLRFAAGTTGKDRALLAHALAACTTGARGTQPPAPSSPESVAVAVAHVTAAAQLVVRDATLAIQAELEVDYRGV